MRQEQSCFRISYFEGFTIETNLDFRDKVSEHLCE